MKAEEVIIIEEITSLKDIAQKIPQDYSVKEKARMAYIELCRNSFYNTKYKYLWGTKEVDAFNESTAYTNPNVGICKKFTEQYVQILRMLNIKAREIRTAPDEYGTYHTSAEFTDEDGNNHMASPAEDLARVQSHSRTNHFAIGTIDRKELESIDLKIGYISESNRYLDDYLPEMRDMFNGYDLNDYEKLNMFFHFLPRIFDIHKMGDDEQFKTLKFLIHRGIKLQDTNIYRSYNRFTEKEDYYVKSFIPATPNKEPHSCYKIFNKSTREYEDTTLDDLRKTEIIQNKQKYY